MYYALIKDSKVQNIIVADDSFVEIIKAEWDAVVKIDNYETSGIGPGTEYVDSKFVVMIPEVLEETQE